MSRPGRYSKFFNILNPRLWVYAIRIIVTMFSENRAAMSSMSIGSGTHIHVTASFRQPSQISLGDGVKIGPGCVLWPGERGSISVGDNVIFGPNVSLFGSNHGIERGRTIAEQATVVGPIKIGTDCWLGANSVVLPGVTIGDGAVVASGAVVSRDVPEYAVVCRRP